MRKKRTSLEIARDLKSSMPSIGVASKSKRIRAYIWTAERALSLAEGDKQIASEALAILAHLSKPFEKALHTTMRNLNGISAGILTGFPYDFARMAALREGLVRY